MAKSDASKIIKLENKIRNISNACVLSTAKVTAEINVIKSKYEGIDGGKALLNAAVEHIKESQAYKTEPLQTN